MFFLRRFSSVIDAPATAIYARFYELGLTNPRVGVIPSLILV